MEQATGKGGWGGEGGLEYGSVTYPRDGDIVNEPVGRCVAELAAPALLWHQAPSVWPSDSHDTAKRKQARLRGEKVGGCVRVAAMLICEGCESGMLRVGLRSSAWRHWATGWGGAAGSLDPQAVHL